MYGINNFVHTMKWGKYILVCNTKTGSYMKLPEKYYSAMLALKLDENSIRKNGDLYKLFKKLIEMECIVDSAMSEKKREEYPETVYFSLTNRCNLHCIHCCTDAGMGNRDLLSTEEIFEAVKRIITLNPEAICFTGGEPMMRIDILEILQYARRNFYGKIILSTNGTLINSGNVESIIQLIDNISISMDGYDEKSCSYVRGAGVFNKCCSVIDLLHEHNFNEISLSMILTGDISENREKFEKLCKKYSVKSILRTLEPLGRGKDVYSELKGKLPEMESEMYVGCRACFPGQRELHISFDGKIYPCGGTFGIDEFGFADILDSDLYEKLTEQRKNHDLSCISLYRSWNCEECNNCEIQLFCPLCLGEKYVLLKEGKLETEFCGLYRKNMKKRLERVLCNG